MESSRNTKFDNDMDVLEQFEDALLRVHHPRSDKNKKPSLAVQKFVQAQDDSRRAVSFTYQAARFEEGWLLDTLGYFMEQQWISDVLSKIRVGKEASVYLCRSGSQVQAPLLAAKIYRPPMLRSLKNDHIYRQGRAVLDEDGTLVKDHGTLKAIQQKSGFGVEALLQSWIAHEFKTLRKLHDAGADVPAAYEMGGNAILLEYIGEESRPAPTLNTVRLRRGDVQPLFDQVLRNLRLMLAHGIVHADLSAYNLLYRHGKVVLIDFPQVILPGSHPAGFQIFRRDVARVCEYFTQQGLRCDPASLAPALWRQAGYPLRQPVNPALLDGDDPADRRLWDGSSAP